MCNLIRCDHCRCEQVRYLDGKCIVCLRPFPVQLSGDDLIVWPDNTYCDASELHQFGWKSDDYQRIPYGTLAYDAAMDELTAQ